MNLTKQILVAHLNQQAIQVLYPYTIYRRDYNV